MLSKKCLLNETFSLTGGGIYGIFYLSGFLNETKIFLYRKEDVLPAGGKVKK